MIPLRSHYRLSDLVLEKSTKELEEHVARGRVDMPEWVEIQNHHLKSLENAEAILSFHRLAMSVQMESALPTDHESEPFVHVFTSLPDQGVGSLDLLHARKDLLQEIISSNARGTRTDSLKELEQEIDERIDELEKSEPIEDGTIQVRMGEFFKDEDYGAVVSEAKEFPLFLPSLGKGFEDRDFPSDTTIHFQVHSKILNNEGNASHQLTGTGFLHLSKLVKEVINHASKGKEEDYMVSVQIPLKLDSVSSQEPDAKMVYRVSRAHDLQAENEQLYQGSLFLYVDLRDKDTQDFFQQFERGTGFTKPSRDDITSGNFAHVATAMRMHIVRDMAPFIPQFTKSIPISLEEEGGIGERVDRVFSGWTFEPSLPEGQGIHAPYNKGNVHTPPGFTYFSDRAMQRLPNTEFILHVANTVLDRWDMSEKDFVRYANNPVMKDKVTGKMKLCPHYIDVLAITSETLTAYPTSMNYRGDYADMNTTVVKKLSEGLDHETFHHLEHGTGMTRIPAVSSSSSKWNPSKRIGTEMFGDAVIDKSGDCEDFAKLIDRMVAGVKTSKSTHPLVASLQNVLSNYEPYSVLSSVTSRSIREAPSTSNAPRRKKEGKRFHVAHSGVEVGSAEDLRAGIGAHMWTILLPSSMVEKAVQATRRRTKTLKAVDVSDEHMTFIQENIPPLILEGTGPALSLLLAKESYHSTMSDKVVAVNTDLARLEALARMMTGFTSDQITTESMRQSNAIFSPFTIPIQTNRIIDLNANERPSPFYRMAVEMFAIDKDDRVVPSALVQLEKRKNDSKPFPLVGKREENMYWRARTIPVQLGPREEKEEEETLIGYPYGINLTDLVHRREDIFGMLETIRSSSEEQRAINNVMRHAPPSPVIRLAPKEERAKTESLARRVEKILNFEDSEDSLQRTLSRGYMGRPQDLYEVHMYIRTDNLEEEDVKRLADHFADNGFVGQAPIRVKAESFTKGHHLLRISVPVDVTGVKQLYFESDALAERLDTPSSRRGGGDVTKKQKAILLNELKKLMA